MKQFKVIKEFRDKYTDEHYRPGVIFVSDESERIADLQERGLIGGEILQSPAFDVKEVKVTEEADTSKDVKIDAPSRKKSTKDKPE